VAAAIFRCHFWLWIMSIIADVAEILNLLVADPPICLEVNISCKM